MYFSESFHWNPAAFIPIIFVIAAIFLPCFTAWRLQSKKLLLITLAGGFFSFLIIPWFVGVYSLYRELDEDHSLPPKPWMYSTYWLILVLIFLLFPYLSLSIVSMNGVQVLQLMAIGQDSSFITIPIILFLITGFFSCIISFFLKSAKLLIGEYIFLVINSFCYFLVNLFLFGVEGFLSLAAGFGSYLIPLLYLSGTTAMYYMIWRAIHPSYASNNKQSPGKSADPLISINKERLDGIKKQASSQIQTIHNKAQHALLNIARPSLVIQCKSGEYTGAKFFLEQGQELKIGTDPRLVNLILRAPEISGIHCTITCPAKSNSVLLLDTSTNGTYLASGTRLPKNLPMEFPLPCSILFGNTPELFEIARK